MKPKKKPFNLNSIFEENKKRLGEPVDERWLVKELTVERTQYNEFYGTHDLVSRHCRSFRTFDSEKEAREFMNTHEAEDGFCLELKHEKCYERIERVWI